MNRVEDKERAAASLARDSRYSATVAYNGSRLRSLCLGASLSIRWNEVETQQRPLSVGVRDDDRVFRAFFVLSVLYRSRDDELRGKGSNESPKASASEEAAEVRMNGFARKVYSGSLVSTTDRHVRFADVGADRSQTERVKIVEDAEG
ncbi:beta-glucan synthesis-associated protein [Pseudozyma hubeiensis SY62]|uniref:Beta-glucan synthesis-associated protein n=1 Tax=Pseudozyma hubeiensis (strain SY62) TaxID=1305764 RepID=R9P673_PSEHS|nr:beta-glucan synthesis-associated protein [Pseudozyma hubeiensis SY62]GAC93615.1 beta-glucan synthesis-associated protein [Pseudozyma hubeiensis SY62]